MTARQGLFSLAMVDKYGIEGNTQSFVEIDDTKTVAQLLADLSSWSDVVAPLSQAVGTRERVILEVPTGNDPTTAVGDIEKGTLWNFGNASTTYAQGMWIPDVNPSILNSSGLVDLSNVNVTAFITFMTTVHTAVTLVTKGLQALSNLIDVLISFRKHRKPLARKTKEI